MAKISVPTIASGFASTTALNNAFDSIEAEFNNKVLYRNNPSGEANQMENDIDLNNHSLLNVAELNGFDVTDFGGSLNIISTNITDINSVADSIDDVSSVAGNISNVTTVAGNITEVGLVGTNINAVVAVGTDLTGSPIVVDYGDLTAATNPASPTGALGAVYAIHDDIVTVAAIDTEVVTVATNLTAIVNASTSVGIIEQALIDTQAAEAAAAVSATNAASSATTATTQATNAASSASNAATSATNAENSATSAATQASNASTSATNAADSATAAASSYDSFDDRYLGAKASAPSTDNDGNTLLVGAIYYNTTVPQLYIWNGTVWDNAAFNASGAVTSFNTRTGAVTLSSGDVTGALTYTPVNPTSAAITGGTINGTAVGATVPGTGAFTTITASSTLDVAGIATLGTGAILGTPASGTLTNCTFPTLNQSTTGTAAGLSATLAVGSGGTGASTLATNNVLLGNDTSALQAVAPGASGNVLTSNGTTWTSATVASGGYTSKTVTTNTTLTSDAEIETGRNLRINHGINLAVPYSSLLMVRKYATGTTL